jgi:putative phosphoesterase
MRVAFLSDIHANLPALAAAVASAERHRAERIFVLGDIVGVGPHPVEVIRFLSKGAYKAILGNQDRKVLEMGTNQKRLRKLMNSGKPRKTVMAWTAHQLGKEERAWLGALPARLSLALGGVKTLLVHGSVLSDMDYVYPSITARALRAKLGNLRPALLVCGHSHIPFCKRVAGVQVINSGAVGLSIDGDPRGSLAIADLENGAIRRCRIIRFPYAYENVAADRKARKMPGAETGTAENG